MEYVLTAMGYTAVGYASWKVLQYIGLCILAMFGIEFVKYDPDEGYDDDEDDDAKN